ncbi:integrase core domain-containing protein [Rhodanobacter sp. BL-MT-08]
MTKSPLRSSTLLLTQSEHARDAKEKIESWRADYNDFHPHSFLADIPPAQFAKTFCNTHQPPISLL